MGWGELASQVCIFPVSQPDWKAKKTLLSFQNLGRLSPGVSVSESSPPGRHSVRSTSGTKCKLGVNFVKLSLDIGKGSWCSPVFPWHLLQQALLLAQAGG